jgi:hypothetical protein
MTETTSSVPAMREPLDGITVHINRVPISASTTIGTIGAHVLVLTTAIPGQPTTLTSSYLARSDAAMAVSRLIADAGGEHLQQHTLGPTDHHATLAGACLLDHAAALRELLGERTDALVTVDVDLSTLTSVARSWGTVHR